MSNYDSDDALPRSPGLEAVRPRATPSVSPPPIVTHHITISTSAQNVSPPSSRRRKKPNRRKTRPSQGDSVLIRVMAPNQPDIARQVGEQALNSDSGSETDDEDMEARSQTTEPASESAQTDSTQHSSSPADLHTLQETAQKALDNTSAPGPVPAPKYPPSFHRDSVVEADPHSPSTLAADTPVSQASYAGTQTSGIRVITNGVDLKSPANSSSQFAATSPKLSGERHGSYADGHPPEDSIATSPNLRELTIPQSRGSPSQKLPALQNPHSPSRDGSVGSPNQERRLPSFRHISELAETAKNEQETNRSNGYPHRQSISSIGQSPTSGTRQLSISSPFTPLSAPSPHSANSDIFLRSGQHLTLFSTRRPSQASDNGPFSALHSASTNDSYQSSDGLSPRSQTTPIEGRGQQRMSIDGALTSRTLPPPVGPNIQHVPPHGSGGFKCEYPGCNAAPFQTQYLLK